MLEIEPSYALAISTPECISRGNEAGTLKRHLHSHAESSTVHNSHDSIHLGPSRAEWIKKM